MRIFAKNNDGIGLVQARGLVCTIVQRQRAAASSQLEKLTQANVALSLNTQFILALAFSKITSGFFSLSCCLRAFLFL